MNRWLDKRVFGFDPLTWLVTVTFFVFLLGWALFADHGGDGGIPSSHYDSSTPYSGSGPGAR